MGERKRIFLLIAVMAVACIVVTGCTIAVLYRTALLQQREVLVATAQSQARLIEAITEFNTKFLNDHPDGTERSTLDQLTAAHMKYRGIGKTGEFTLAKREGDNIVFLLSHRYYDFGAPKPVPIDSELAEPMRRALSGLSGTVIGLDYRGVKVLAAYEPVAIPDWGIVAKIDLIEMRNPFQKASFIALLVAVLVIIVGASLFVSISDPIIARLQTHSQNLAKMVKSLQDNERMLQEAHDNLEERVSERTNELASTNWNLEMEVYYRSRVERKLRALWKIAELGNLGHQALCDNILQGSLEMTQSKYAFYGFLSQDESCISVYSWSRDVAEQCLTQENQINFPIARAGIWADAVRDRKVLIVNDYEADHSGKRGLPEGHIPLTRILVVPVFNQDRIVAVVAVANKSEDYEEEEADQLASYATGVQVIMDQRKTESELKESENKYSALVENSLTGIYIAQNSKIVFANRRFAEIYGYSHHEVMGMESRTFIHPEERTYFEEIQQKRLNGQPIPTTYEIKGIKKRGETLWTNRSNTVIEYQEAPAVLGNVIDITKRKEMEEYLRKSESECRILSQKSIEAEEIERKRIAREIHDGIGQSLAAIKYRAESIYLTANREKYGKAEELNSLIQMIQKAMEEMRRVHNDLHPAYIDELGLIKTLSYFCEEFNTTYSTLKVETAFELSEPEVPEYLKTFLFRIFQEAMNNAARHSRADLIRCHLRKNGNRIELSVKDNGIGFDPNNGFATDENGRGLGLYSMKERAKLSGGQLEIESSPGTGTLIRGIWLRGDTVAES